MAVLSREQVSGCLFWSNSQQEGSTEAGDSTNAANSEAANVDQGMESSKNVAVSKGKDKKIEPGMEGGSREEETLTYSDENFELELSSFGMSFNSIKLNHTNRDGQAYHFEASENGRLYETRLVGRKAPLVFDIKKVGDNTFVGTSTALGDEHLQKLGDRFREIRD